MLQLNNQFQYHWMLDLSALDYPKSHAQKSTTAQDHRAAYWQKFTNRFSYFGSCFIYNLFNFIKFPNHPITQNFS